MAQIIDGKRISEEKMKRLYEEVVSLKKDSITPGLAAMLVGDDPASEVYVKMKIKACEELGMYWLVKLGKSKGINLETMFPERKERFIRLEKIDQETVIKEIQDLNENDSIHGILVQLPLPKDIDKFKLLDEITRYKDVDGLGSYSVACLSRGEDWYEPCTPKGILTLLDEYKISLAGKHVVIVGRSEIVGKPLRDMLLSKKKRSSPTVTICHSETDDLPCYTTRADILVAAMGKPKYITKDMVKEGSVIIDVGVNRIEDPTKKSGYRLVGDVDYERVFDKVSYITPVPGGVGPMTIVSLMENTVEAALIQTGRKSYPM